MNFSEVRNAVVMALDRLGIRYSIEPADGSIRGDFNFSVNRVGLISFRIAIVNQIVVCYAWYSNERFAITNTMLSLFNELNVRMLMGNFEFDFQRSLVYYKYALPWSALASNLMETINTLVRVPVDMCDKCLGVFQEVKNGRAIPEALKLI